MATPNRRDEVRVDLLKSYLKENGVKTTKVMMSVGTDYAVICSESIKDKSERKMVLNELKKLGKKIVEISPEQMEHMCSNILELHTTNGENVIIMSTTAYKNFSRAQKKELEKSGAIISFDIHTIENIGGGSARCMVAEIFHN